MSEPIRVLITGAAGQIAYSLLYMVSNGDVFGKHQPVILHLLDIPPMMPVLEGNVMELNDCALPLVRGIVPTTDLKVAFTDIDVAFLVGAMPRKQGMERRDLLAANVNIFKEQGRALDAYAKKSVKILVVGNPANTNALICSMNAPSIPKENFSAMTRLDQNRAVAEVAHKLGVRTEELSRVVIWGNHSSTQFPDLSNTKIVAGGSEKSIDIDKAWVEGEFVKFVQNRGAAVIAARKLSSSMSAAKAACDHMRDWFLGTQGRWVSMAVMSDGSYGTPVGVMFSFPVTVDEHRQWHIVQGLSVSDYARGRLDTTGKELCEERDDALLATK